MPKSAPFRLGNKLAVGNVGGWKNTTYDPKFCDTVLALGERGKTITSIKCELGVDDNTIVVWRKKHQEFDAAVTRALDKSAQWWEGIAQQNLITGREEHFNERVWSMCMMNMHGWNKKEDITSNGNEIASTATAVALMETRMLSNEERRCKLPKASRKSKRLR
jgi:transposase-like protein